MVSRQKNTQASSPNNFEEALEELEQLVAHMESGALALDDLLAKYQRGAQLIAFCKNKLKTVEQQVQVLENETLKPLSVNTSGDTV